MPRGVYERKPRKLADRDEDGYVHQSVSAARNGGHPSGPTGRLMDDKGTSSDVLTSHWMPKEGPDWTCPHCGAQFQKVDGNWQKGHVA